MITAFDVYEIVNKIVGPYYPSDDNWNNEVRLDNLRKLILVTDKLLFEIDHISSSKCNKEFSRVAYEFLQEVKCNE